MSENEKMTDEIFSGKFFGKEGTKILSPKKIVDDI